MSATDDAVDALRASAQHYRDGSQRAHAECVRLEVELTDTRSIVESMHRAACELDDAADALLA